jgi:hypothetical protein
MRPFKGRVYDPACGSGGMFVQSEKFIEGHQGKIDSVSIYGQESNPTTWRLCKMNLAIRHIDNKMVFVLFCIRNCGTHKRLFFHNIIKVKRYKNLPS